MSGNSLQIGKSVLVELNQAREWTPSTVGPGTAAPLPNVAAGLQRLSGILQVLDSVEGLGDSILLISAVGDDRAVPDFPGESLVARAAGSIQELARACMVQDIAQVALIGRELIGLGAGSDAIGG